MNWAKQAFRERSERFSITAEMGLRTFYTELDRFWDQLSLSVLTNVGDALLRSIYALLIQQAKRSTDQADWLSAPAVFVEAVQGVEKKGPAWQWGSLVLGEAVLAGFAALLFIRSEVFYGVVACAAFLMMLASGVTAALRSGKAKRTHIEGRAEERLNTAKVMRSLEQLACAIDGDAENLYGMLTVPAADESVDGLDLASALLRVKLNVPEALPEELSSAMTAYFARHGIKPVMFSSETRAMFTVLPSNGDKTIEPALVMNDKLLKTGVACTKGA